MQIKISGFVEGVFVVAYVSKQSFEDEYVGFEVEFELICKYFMQNALYRKLKATRVILSCVGTQVGVNILN